MKGTPLGFIFFFGHFFAPLCAFAETELSGYYKNIFFQNGDNLYTGNRLRLKYLIDFNDSIKGEFQYTNQLIFGQFPMNTIPLNTTNFLKTDRVLLRSEGLDWTQSFYRAFVSFKVSHIDLMIGRQRIAWGTGRFWNPTDLLNPFDPTNIEGSERTGVDALNLKINTDLLSFVSLVGAPGESPQKSSLAARYHTTIGPNDLSLMTGKFKDNLVIGGDYSGSFKGAGVRIESSYTLAPQKNFTKLVFSVDYQFPHLYVLGEYFYNGQGENNKNNYNYLARLNGRLMNIGQNYFGLALSSNISPLMAVSAQSLINLNDGSLLAGASLSYSISSSTDLVFGFNAYIGLPDTEYGPYPTLVYNQLQWSF